MTITKINLNKRQEAFVKSGNQTEITTLDTIKRTAYFIAPHAANQPVVKVTCKVVENAPVSVEKQINTFARRINKIQSELEAIGIASTFTGFEKSATGFEGFIAFA